APPRRGGGGLEELHRHVDEPEADRSRPERAWHAREDRPALLDDQRTVGHGAKTVIRARFSTFIGVDLGGGKGKNTAVALLRRDGEGVRVDRYDTGDGHPWYDERLVAF